MNTTLVLWVVVAALIIAGAAVWWWFAASGKKTSAKVSPSSKNESKDDKSGMPAVPSLKINEQKSEQLLALKQKLQATREAGAQTPAGKRINRHEPRERPKTPVTEPAASEASASAAPIAKEEGRRPVFGAKKEEAQKHPVKAPASEPEPVAPVEMPVQAPVEPVAVMEEVAPSATILLVDDSKVVRVKTEKLLSANGFRVTLAVDGIDALSKMDGYKPDLIITDIEMPNLDGFGLVRNVRNNLKTSDIPIIVMTSHVNLHLDIAATEGINGFLPKPFNEQDMLDQVRFLTA